MEEEQEQEYYLAIKDRQKPSKFVIYTSESFKLSEIDVINLIKILLVERRSRDIGRRVLAMYKDSNEHQIEEIKEKLKKIGIKENEEKPIYSRAKTK